MDVVRGKKKMLMRREEVEEEWRWIEKIIKEWELKRKKVKGYKDGKWGN